MGKLWKVIVMFAILLLVMPPVQTKLGVFNRSAFMCQLNLSEGKEKKPNQCNCHWGSRVCFKYMQVECNLSKMPGYRNVLGSGF